MENNKKRCTIIAKNKTGLTETITLYLHKDIVKRLEAAASNTYPDGQPNSYLLHEINDMYEADKLNDPLHYVGVLSKSQHYRLGKFLEHIFIKFYKCTLTIESK